jgi:acyl-CoA thioester hydrolase
MKTAPWQPVEPRGRIRFDDASRRRCAHRTIVPGAVDERRPRAVNAPAAPRTSTMPAPAGHCLLAILPSRSEPARRRAFSRSVLLWCGPQPRTCTMSVARNADPALAAPSGAVDPAAGEHAFPVRVYYEDTDAAGIVYYVNYLKFAERARTEMLRLLGREQQRMMEADGVAFAVKSARVEYYRPARLDDALQIRTGLIEVAGASLKVRQRVFRGDELLADMQIRLAVMDRNGRPARLPADIRAALAPSADPNRAMR